MTVKLYNKTVIIDPSDPLVQIMAGRFVITLACIKGNTRVHKSTEITVQGSTWAEVIEQGYAAAEAIERCSRGRLVKLQLVCGHYIKDVNLYTITDNDRAMTITMRSVDGSKTQRVYVPFVRSDMTDDAIQAEVENIGAGLLMKNPAGTGLLYFPTEEVKSMKKYHWNAESKVVVDNTNNSNDSGADTFLGTDSEAL